MAENVKVEDSATTISNIDKVDDGAITINNQEVALEEGSSITIKDGEVSVVNKETENTPKSNAKDGENVEHTETQKSESENKDIENEEKEDVTVTVNGAELKLEEGEKIEINGNEIEAIDGMNITVDDSGTITINMADDELAESEELNQTVSTPNSSAATPSSINTSGKEHIKSLAKMARNASLMSDQQPHNELPQSLSFDDLRAELLQKEQEIQELKNMMGLNTNNQETNYYKDFKPALKDIPTNISFPSRHTDILTESNFDGDDDYQFKIGDSIVDLKNNDGRFVIDLEKLKFGEDMQFKEENGNIEISDSKGNVYTQDNLGNVTLEASNGDKFIRHQNGDIQVSKTTGENFEITHKRITENNDNDNIKAPTTESKLNNEIDLKEGLVVKM